MRSAAEMAEWIQNESKMVDELSGRLCKAAACIPTENLSGWLDDLRGQFERFRAHYQKHMALEEGGGCLAPVLEQWPELTGEVEHLRSEHREIGVLMKAIYDELCDLSPDQPLTMLDCCRRIRNLMEIINHHTDRENLILSLAFSRDVGTSD